MEKINHSFDKAYKWIYFNTFLGEHSSDQARIDSVNLYIDNNII